MKSEKEIRDKQELAVQYKHNGHNCAQAVLAAYSDELNMNRDDLKKFGASFGVGMGCLEATCGALCAAQMILGLKEYEGTPLLVKAKKFHQEFEEKSGATICKELKGVESGKTLCECDDCVRNAVLILEEQLHF